MLRKLLKYDFRCMLKQFALVWPTALIIALLNGFVQTAPGGFRDDLEGSINTVIMLVFVGVMIAMGVIAAVFIISRFSSGLLRDEGYLMFTLPVKPRQLIISKLITATAVIVISVIVGVVSMLLLSAGAVGWDNMLGGLREVIPMFMSWMMDYPQWIAVVIEGVLALLFSIMSGILLIYFAIAVGHMFSSHRLLASIIAYVVISSVGSRLIVGGAGMLTKWGLNGWINEFEAVNSYPFTMFTFGAVIIINIIYCLIYFLGTDYILSKKLNLE